MVRFQFKQRDAVNAKILKDIKFPLMLDVFDLCTSELQQKLVPVRSRFKVRTVCFIVTIDMLNAASEVNEHESLTLLGSVL
jgi:hypothetical protein